MESPICRYCGKVYSAFHEPMYTVCVCEDEEKYAHGSCFRAWLLDHKYGVCDVCLTKTIIVRDGIKPVCKLRLPPNTPASVYVHLVLSILTLLLFITYCVWWIVTKCPQIYCILIFLILLFMLLILLSCCRLRNKTWLFLKALYTANVYWKIVQCKEVIGQTKHKSVRRHSDMPVLSDDGTTYLRKDGTPHLKRNELYEEDEAEGFEFPELWVPRNHPRVKKIDEYQRKESKMHEANVVGKNRQINQHSSDPPEKIFVGEANVKRPDVIIDVITNYHANNCKTNYNKTEFISKAFVNRSQSEPLELLQRKSEPMPLKRDVEFKTLETGVTYFDQPGENTSLNQSLQKGSTESKIWLGNLYNSKQKSPMSRSLEDLPKSEESVMEEKRYLSSLSLDTILFDHHHHDDDREDNSPKIRQDAGVLKTELNENFILQRSSSFGGRVTDIFYSREMEKSHSYTAMNAIFLPLNNSGMKFMSKSDSRLNSKEKRFKLYSRSKKKNYKMELRLEAEELRLEKMEADEELKKEIEEIKTGPLSNLKVKDLFQDIPVRKPRGRILNGTNIFYAPKNKV